MENKWKEMSFDELFMREVYLIASKSKDIKTKIGAVLVRDKSILKHGYNGLPRKVNDNVPERQERPEKYFWFAHAERNSIYQCAKEGVCVDGATMYTQGIPCCDCAIGCIQAGVKEIVVHKQWRSANKTNDKWLESAKRSMDMFNEAGVIIRWLDVELGIDGYCNGEVIKV